MLSNEAIDTRQFSYVLEYLHISAAPVVTLAFGETTGIYLTVDYCRACLMYILNSPNLRSTEGVSSGSYHCRWRTGIC